LQAGLFLILGLGSRRIALPLAIDMVVAYIPAEAVPKHQADRCGSMVLTSFERRSAGTMTTMKIQVRQVSASTSEATLRTHHVLIDRPVEKGGTDKGPMGGDLFLASVGGCFMSNLLAAIRARGEQISDAHLEVIGTIAESPARFSALELYVTAEGANPELLEKLVEIADRGCIMMNTLRGKLDVRIRIGALA
jgi:putative redox protein